VPPVTLAEVESFARAVGGDAHDAASEAALARAYEEHRAGRREAIARFEIQVDGTRYASVYAALANPASAFAEAELALVDPPPPGPAWEWSTPIARVAFQPDGAADVTPPGGRPTRMVARWLARDIYPIRRARDGGRRALAGDGGVPLLALAPTAEAVRRGRIVPFGVALLLYGTDARYRLDLDLVEGTVERDPRAGHLPIARRVRRTSRISHEVDTALARGELSVRVARVLEVLVESHGLTPFEVSQIFGGVREFGSSALKTLAARGLATLDRQTGVYRPRFEGFRPEVGRGTAGAAEDAPLPNPALRTSVMELLAAADSRATCPLCGDPLPPGPRGMLCPRCQAEVGAVGGRPASP